MIIYNVSCSVDKSIINDWLKWIIENHIPEILSCSRFIEAKIYRVVSSKENDITYAIAYKCHNIKDLHHYQANFALDLQKKHLDKFGEKVFCFRTVLEEICIKK